MCRCVHCPLSLSRLSSMLVSTSELKRPVGQSRLTMIHFTRRVLDVVSRCLLTSTQLNYILRFPLASEVLRFPSFIWSHAEQTLQRERRCWKQLACCPVRRTASLQERVCLSTDTWTNKSQGPKPLYNFYKLLCDVLSRSDWCRRLSKTTSGTSPIRAKDSRLSAVDFQQKALEQSSSHWAETSCRFYSNGWVKHNIHTKALNSST